MKKIILMLFSIYTLSACQTAPLDSDGADNSGLDVQYEVMHESGNQAANINTQLGAGYIANGNYERALVKLNKALQLDPKHPMAHNYLGVLYGRLERPDKARSQFNQALKLAPGNSSIQNNYAVFLCEQKEYEHAQKLFKKVLDNPIYDDLANAYQSAAWCAYDNNDIELSEKLYRKALKIDANSLRSLLGLAKVNYKNKVYQYAWNYFERYYKASALDADALWLGINILNNLEKPDINLLSSYELQLKSKYPDSDQTKWFYQGKQEY
ncbi:MAG: type IV pilus biogenesis/stability protein PilW [Gammaproteobacteria bacterium]|nr:type IV pilus biogenesis/stability protein PilW [Gammaproteobacteria bacterium]